MEELLQETLAPGEQIVWKGRPAPQKLSQASDRPQQLRLWIVFAVAMALTLAVLFPYLIRIGRPWDVLVICFVVINAIPLALALRPGMDQRDLEKRCLCAITDRRVISVVKDNVHTLPLADLPWEVADRDGEAGSIRFGACVARKKPNDRADAVVGYTDDETGAKGFVFYHMAKVDQIAALLPAATAVK